MPPVREEPQQISVTEEENQYVRSTEGPTDDTTVHTRNTPGIVPDLDPALRRGDPEVRRSGEAAPDPEMVSLRQSVRRPEEVERERPRVKTRMSPVVTGLLFFALVVGIGTIGLLTFLQRDRSAAPVVEQPPAPTEIGGGPVRKGMKGG